MAKRIVIEWAKTTLRMASSEVSGSRARLKSIRVQPIDPTGDVSKALRALLGDRMPSASQVIVVLAREQVITRVVKFPTIQSAELSQMVGLYAKAQLPYPPEQAVFDFHIV